MFNLKKIKFKTILSNDLKLILRWRNSIFIRSKMLNQKKISYNEHKSWFKKLKKDTTNKAYMITYDKKKIGVANISQIDNRNKLCTWGYYIALKNYRYLALLVEIKLIDLMFYKFNIRKIWGRTISTNKKILKIHKILGFKLEGLQKEHIKVNNYYRNIVLTSLLKNEWKDRKNKILRKLKKI